MCGIAGGIDLNKDIVQNVQDSLYHRGPNEQNSIVHQNITLIHTRLSIQDIKHGIQPLERGDFTMVFNGEIYNHLELRKKYNLDCKTLSDTETLLLLYIKYGKSILDELDGMFAFAILDKKNKKLILARDRVGKKPLYYYHKDNKFCFASELNALKAMTNLKIDNDIIYQYLRFGFFYDKNTPYKNCYDFPAGNIAEYSLEKNTFHIEKWWNVKKAYLTPSKDDFSTAKEKVERYLDLAVKRRLETSDLEVGTFLSGGIDSALVTAFASKYHDDLKTFTVSFEGAYDEAPLAKLVAQKYKTDHHELKISFDNLSNDIEDIICNYGEPFFDSSAIPSYYVSKVAKEHLTVILNGDGADELFGGYRRYVPFSKYDFFKQNSFRQLISQSLIGVIPIAHEKKSYYNFLYRLINLSSKKGTECYLSTTSDIFEDVYQKAFKNPSNTMLKYFIHDFDEINKLSLSGLQKLMLLDFKTILFGGLLVKMDIATMSNSLEGRSPFLSKELLEYAPTIDDNYKINGKTTKYILRQIAKDYLPPIFINQPKRGFEIPLKQWVNKNLKEMINGYLSSKDVYSLNFIKKDFLDKLIDDKINIASEKRAKILWALFVLEVWYKNET
jgi:asparagine synthase (glutamine-hydrolysing)